MKSFPPFGHRLTRRGFLGGAAAMAAAWRVPLFAEDPATYMYVGCYTARGPGISVYKIDSATGALSLQSVAPAGNNPSFVVLDPHRRFLYCCNEVANVEGAGTVSAFSVDPNTGALTLLNRATSGGTNPAHISLDPTGRFVLAANYSGGSVTSVEVQPDGQLGAPTDLVRHTGELGPNRARQEAPHAHMILPDPGGRFVLANDLALDKTFIYILNRDTGKLTASDPGFVQAPPGGGPRHLAFHPSGRFVFVLNELTSSLSSFSWDSQRGILNLVRTLSTLQEGYAGVNTTAQVVVSADGRYVYASNRGNDTIALFAINQTSGDIAFIERTHTQGETPRNFNIDPTGNFMYIAHQNTDNIVTFRVDQATGKLTHTGQFTGTGQPVCLIFSTPPPAGNSAKAGVTFWANPNPVILSGRPASSAQTTLAWNAPGSQEVEIRIGAPNGVNMGRHWYYGTAQVSEWLTDGMTFYLQDVTGGKPLTAENTLGVARITVRP